MPKQTFNVQIYKLFTLKTEEKAQIFSDDIDGDRAAIVIGRDVIIESSGDAELNLTKRDVLKTYKDMKEEYEYEQ